MAGRSLWSGTVTFGMVAFPVKLYSGAVDNDVAFNTAHSCGTRLNQKRWCTACDREVTPDEVHRVYQYAKDKHVEITNADLAQLPVPSKETLVIGEFVQLADVDASYVEKTYYAEPEPAGMGPCALLLAAMQRKGVAAVARITLRKREQPVLLRAAEGGRVLLVHTLRPADEMRLHQADPLPDVPVDPQQLEMACQLVGMLERPWQPEVQVRDVYREQLQALVDAKVAGAVQPEVEKRALTAPPMDVMAQLRASMEAARKAKEEEQAA